MLLERLTYQEDFPLNILVANAIEDPIHYHSDIEFIYVLQGEIKLKNGYCIYDLKEGDIFTNAGNEVHSITSSGGDNIVAQIQVSVREFSQYFPNLSSACYRTYSKRTDDKKQRILKTLMLQLLSTYEKRGLNYKSECIYTMVEIIKHLEKHFNLFAFDKGMVVGFDRGNQVAVDRISRICTYIYQNYAGNISLTNLSEMEYLSSFYLSHLIKDFTGMNFREFLSFARVEMSEVPLLETNKKISQVARDVGFSATSYYKKYFEKWFGHGPQEHRDMYKDEVKSDLKPAIYEELPPNKAIQIVMKAQSESDAQLENRNLITSLSIDVDIDINIKPIDKFQCEINLIVTPEDYSALGPSIMEPIVGIAPKKLTILKEKGKAAQVKKFQKYLEESGFHPEISTYAPQDDIKTYAYDSIAYPIYLLGEDLKGNIDLRLRDRDEKENRIIKGEPAVLTCNGIKKPSYYAYSVMSRVQGDVIARGNQYFVVRMNKAPKSGGPGFAIFAYNYNDTIKDICKKEADEADVKSAINNFLDEFNMNMSINVEAGYYSIIKYHMTKENNIFAHLSALDFKDKDIEVFSDTNLFSGWPMPETYIEDVRKLLNINFSLKGADIQMAYVLPRGYFKS